MLGVVRVHDQHHVIAAELALGQPLVALPVRVDQQQGRRGHSARLINVEVQTERKELRRRGRGWLVAAWLEQQRDPRRLAGISQRHVQNARNDNFVPNVARNDDPASSLKAVLGTRTWSAGAAWCLDEVQDQPQDRGHDQDAGQGREGFPAGFNAIRDPQPSAYAHRI
jgi:hypothetical protein